MTRRYDLQGRLELDGTFWPVTDSSKTFSAHLSASQNWIEITKASELVGPERFFEDDEVPPILHGLTTLGPCTLIGLQGVPGTKTLLGPSGQVLVAPKFRTSVCVVGVHLTDESVPIFQSGMFSYMGLGDWLPPAAQITLTDKALLISHPFRTPTLTDFSVLATKTRISLTVVSRMHWNPSGQHSSSRDEPQISIHPSDPMSLAWFLETAHRLENFLSLCLGSSARLRAVQLKTSNGEEGWLVQHRRRKVEEPDEQCWVRGTGSQLAESTAAWLSMPQTFRPLEDLIYGTIRNSSMFAETEFLSLAQGVESLHRLTDNSATLVDGLTFKGIFKSVLREVYRACDTQTLRERLSDSIRHANEPSFKNRIQSLLTRISSEHVKSLVGDPTLFEQNLRSTRNYFTHPGIPMRKGVLVRPKEIFLFNQKLHALLRLLMLMHIGFREDEVFNAVLYQSRKWT